VKVVDASVVVSLLTAQIPLSALGDEELVAPHLLDSEVMHVLRRNVLGGTLSTQAATTAVEGFMRLDIVRWPADWLRPAIWILRHNYSGYDATYVALAQHLSASSLLTRDRRLAQAPNPPCVIEVV
jgi:predicted nucleic acid-binding protein